MSSLLHAALLASCLTLMAGVAEPTSTQALGDVPSLAAVPRYELPRLERGEVVLLAAAEEKPGGTAVAAVLIRAPAEQVWGVMIDCSRAPEFVPNLRSCRVLERGPGRRLVEHRVKPHPLLPAFTYRFEERWQELRQIAFRRVGGDLAAMEGSWDLEPVGDATLVRYRVSINPGFPVPRWSIRRALRHDIPRLLGALRDRVEGRQEDSR
jgi:ribosome-associated toxin RatA of RatAB toxin-antitoxin module